MSARNVMKRQSRYQTIVRKAGIVAAALGAFVGLSAFAAPASAQEIQLTGPLAGAPPVRQLRQYRKGRFEIAPAISFTLLDEYRRTIVAGARLQYNITDWLGVGAWGGYGVASLTTDLTDQIDATAPRNSRTATNVAHTATFGRADFTAQTAKMEWVAAPQLTLSPFRGKLAMFQKLFVDTDLYLHAGAAFVGLKERGDCGGGGGQLQCSDPKSFALVSRMAVAPTFGLGLTLYPSHFVSVGLEYRALPFAWNRAGFDSRGSGNDANFPDTKIDSEDRTFKFNQMITLAVGFSFPTKPNISE